MIKKVKKRDGRIVDFDKERIEGAVTKAFESVNVPIVYVKDIVDTVLVDLEDKDPKEVPSVENISDLIEKALMNKGYMEVAKSFILYREYRRKIRELKKAVFGTETKTKLSLNAIKVLEGRCLLKDNSGKIIETPEMMFRRVANNIASAEANYAEDRKKGKELTKDYADEYFDLMTSLKFLPNSPALMNAGAALQQLTACFVLPIDDSMTGIFDSLKNAALIHQSGGGTGFSFSRLRPKGDAVKSTQGVASGPVSFMKVFDAATEVIKQGGKRRGANMGVLRVDHPDIIEFITCKQQEGNIANFNISVAITDEFMDALDTNSEYDLVNPRTGDVVKKSSAKSVFDLIVTMAWNNGEPGVIFIDEVNRGNKVPNMGTIESTNPCGEQPLLPYESCNLGSINLAAFVEDGKIQWDELKKVAELGVRFLDDLIDMNRFPTETIDLMSKSSRKIGLGVMGLADVFYLLKIPYNSDEALYLADKIMKFIEDAAIEYSSKLGQERGSFPAFKGSLWERQSYPCMRNAAITTVAPTGTLSMIADVSSGIEPFFSLVYTKTVLSGQDFVYVNKYLEEELRKKGLYNDAIIYKIKDAGSLQDIEEIPEDLKRVFVVSSDIAPEWHIRMQAVFQKRVHSAVSKTINMQNNATIEDVSKAYKLAYDLKCKGLTIYRDGSRQVQVLTKGDKSQNQEKITAKDNPVSKQKTMVEIPKDECPVCKKKMVAKEGCYTCVSCGYSKCSM
ncbi:MAG: adenosylcobalamin-dependent ribonucleoside-diphosphate reductase [Candidatus ainarchaeum sp.]|nr:adenosylcobalamin-dependent ribonucleoside-diphosphate reductase [Candidatus ainarchaeum sp.]